MTITALEYQGLKGKISCFSNTIMFKQIYDEFMTKQTEPTYKILVNFLNVQLSRSSKQYTIYLLDTSNRIVWKNNGSNQYDKYQTHTEIYDTNNLYNYFDVVNGTDYIDFHNKQRAVTSTGTGTGTDTSAGPLIGFGLGGFLNSGLGFGGFSTGSSTSTGTSTSAETVPTASVLKSSYKFVILTTQSVWKEPVVGYYYWQGNFVGSSPATQYYFSQVSAPQTSYQTPSNLISTSSQFNYYGNTFPSGLNTIILFTGYSKVSDILKNLTNYTTGTNMYTDAKNYFTTNGVSNYLLSLCFGGGIASTGGWDTGTSGAIYSIYEACTKVGVPFSYEETGTGNVLSGIGTGTLDYSYNSFTFDIETWGASSNTGSTGTDFINLFNYIKYNPNSNFASWEMVIIVSIAHSCSNYNGTGQQTISQILSDSTGSYDFISNQLYTQNVGTTVEYCANYNILWSNTGSNDTFVYYLSQNKNFITYGLNMCLPSLFYNNLLETGGTNDGNPPNLYFYQSTSTSASPPVATASGWKTINYTTDKGATDFYNGLFSQNNVGLGGTLQWVNGTL